MSSYKIVNQETTLSAAVEDAFSELSSLRDEMRDWADNLEAGNLGQTSKYETVNGTADELDNCNPDDVPELPEGMDDEKITVGMTVHRRKKAFPSRAVRCGNAEGLLNAAIDAVQAKIDSLEEKKEDADESDGLQDELEEFRDRCQEVVDAIGGLDFPGMYG